MKTSASTITVLDNEFVSMWYYPSSGILHHQFHKYLWGDTFREALNKGVDVFRQHHATKWLSDDRKNAALSRADTEWAIGDWFPRVLKAGWKYWAIVLPENVIGQMNMKLFIENYSKQGVTTRVFSDPDDAMKWLETPD
jgi:hypothetical protein